MCSVEWTLVEADLCRSGPSSKRTFVAVDLRQSGPSSKRTFVEADLGRMPKCQMPKCQLNFDILLTNDICKILTNLCHLYMALSNGSIHFDLNYLVINKTNRNEYLAWMKVRNRDTICFLLEIFVYTLVEKWQLFSQKVPYFPGFFWSWMKLNE